MGQGPYRQGHGRRGGHNLTNYEKALRREKDAFLLEGITWREYVSDYSNAHWHNEARRTWRKAQSAAHKAAGEVAWLYPQKKEVRT
jgi:hypothetical protein